MVLLGVLALAIVLGLASYAGYLLWQVRVRKQSQQAAVDKLIEQKQESETYARDSIIVLLRGLQQEQVSLTEVAIRITGLCQVLAEAEVEQYALFLEIADKTSHIPIKDDWKALPRAEKRRLEKQRLEIEDSYATRIQGVVETILQGKKPSAPMVQMYNPSAETIH